MYSKMNLILEKKSLKLFQAPVYVPPEQLCYGGDVYYLFCTFLNFDEKNKIGFPSLIGNKV